MTADVVSQGAMRIRRATAADAEALAEIGARTFFETFAASKPCRPSKCVRATAPRPMAESPRKRRRFRSGCSIRGGVME